jgi:hypothetical protein
MPEQNLHWRQNRHAIELTTLATGGRRQAEKVGSEKEYVQQEPKCTPQQHERCNIPGLEVSKQRQQMGALQRTPERETTIRKKLGRSKVCKGLSTLRRCDQVTQPKAPLDSAAIYPITWSPNKQLETGKRKT